MVILARQVEGLTQLELSRMLGIDQGKLSKIEHGLIRINEELFDALCTALNFPRDFFFQPGEIYPTELYLFRKRKTLPQKFCDQITSLLNIQYLQLLKLYQSVNVETNIPMFDLDEYSSPKEVALKLRHLWKIPFGRIDNLTALVESSGIAILHLDIRTDKFDGIKFVGNSFPLIALNKNMPPDRMRLTLAEEFGHLLMHKIPTASSDDEAREFALEFLIPSNQIEFPSQRITLSHLADLKRYWKVSMAALLYKAKDLGKVTPMQYQYLWKQMSQLKYRKREPAELDPPFENTKLIKKIFNLYKNEYGYTLEDFIKLFSINEDRFKQWWKHYYDLPEKENHLKLVRKDSF